MINIIKKYIHEKILKARRNKVSDLKLKDIIIKSNKENVIQYALSIFKNDPEYYSSISRVITDEVYYNCPINNKSYLENKYDYLMEISRRDLLLVGTDNYYICLNKDPWTFSIFLGLFEIDTNCDSMPNFIENDNEKFVFDINFLVNCCIKKDCIEKSYDELTALALLQIIYIEELKKY